MPNEPETPLTFRDAALLVAGGSLLAMSATGTVPRTLPPTSLARVALPHSDFSLNMSTVRGQKLSLAEQIEIAAKAGYDSFEPWVEEIQALTKEGGGSLGDLKKTDFRPWDWLCPARSASATGSMMIPLSVLPAWSNGSAMPNWLPASAVFAWRRLPAGREATTFRSICGMWPIAIASLLELSVPLGIVPELELWGFAGKRFRYRAGEVAYVLVETAHKDACGLLDVFHIFKGGSDFAGVRVFNGSALHVLHMNDYPKLTRDKATDADRVYPGDGVAPIVTLLRDLKSIGYTGKLSLEVFNRDYWKQDALTVARTGRTKMQAVVDKALA